MIILKHKDTGVVKECVPGFSWTSLFFGPFVPLLRGDIKWAAIVFAVCALIGLCTYGIGSIFVTPVFAYFYNKIYIKDLVEKGYTYIDEAGKYYLVSNGIIDVTLTAEK